MAESNITAKVEEPVAFEDDPTLPPGWQAMVKRFKKKAMSEDGTSHIISLEESFGSLECSFRLSSFSDQAFMIEYNNVRQKSQHTCFGCGSGYANRMVMNGQVEVYCDECKVKVARMDKENNKTNTWLDNF